MIFGTMLLLGLGWFVLNYFLSLGGWIRLQANYLAHKHSPSMKLRIQTSGVVGSSSYKKSLYVSPLENGLWLSAGTISSPFHKPLLIPWQEVDIRIVKVRFVYFAVFTVDDVQISFFASAWNQVQRVRKYLHNGTRQKGSQISELLREATAVQKGRSANPAKKIAEAKPSPSVTSANKTLKISSGEQASSTGNRPSITASDRPSITAANGSTIRSRRAAASGTNRPSIKRIPISKP